MFKSALRDAALVLLGMGIAIGFSTLAQQRGVEAQVESGTCRHHQSDDGSFYQSPQQTNNYLNPGCTSIAVAGLFDNELGWRVAYQDFGTIRARDNRFMRRDDEIRATTGPCDISTLSGCKGSMYGEGNIKGVSFSITRRWPIRGVDLLTEAGLLFFDSEFHAVALKDEDKGLLYAKEGCRWFACPPDLVLGAGLRWQQFYVMARKNISPGHRAQSLTDFNVTEVKVGMAFPFSL